MQYTVCASTYSVYRISSLSECNGFRTWGRELACEGIRQVRTYCMFMQCDLKEIVPEVLPISPSMNVLEYKRIISKLNPMIRNIQKKHLRIKSEFLNSFTDIPTYTRCQVLRPVVSALNTLILRVFCFYYEHYICTYWHAYWEPELVNQQTEPFLRNGSVNTWRRYWASICCYATVGNRYVTIETVAHATLRELR
jgi:hypothetical protein